MIEQNVYVFFNKLYKGNIKQYKKSDFEYLSMCGLSELQYY